MTHWDWRSFDWYAFGFIMGLSFARKFLLPEGSGRLWQPWVPEYWKRRVAGDYLKAFLVLVSILAVVVILGVVMVVIFGS